MAATKLNLLGFDRAALETLFLDLGEKPFRAGQTLKWIHEHEVLDFQRMTNLGKGLRSRLAEMAELRLLGVERHQIAADGTQKWRLRVDAGNCIETVYIPDHPRGTLCVSSQAGCALGCTFCSTARQGFNRNLTSAEIIAQVWMVRQRLRSSTPAAPRITNVVLMGMGEPLLNFDNVVQAINLLLDDFAYGLARRRVTLSTAGVVPAIDRLKAACPVSLAVSLHAPDDELRNELVPLNRKYDIESLIAACRRYVRGETRQKVTFEYVMLAGINDTVEHATRLAARLRDMPAKVNLIPFNPFPQSTYRRSSPTTIDRFREILMAAGLITITRTPRGDDIDAACGQLAGEVTARARRIRGPGRGLASLPSGSAAPAGPSNRKTLDISGS